MQPKVSVIVPIYNVEKYLSTCLDSLVNQTLQDIEIICVNDASPDNSADIVREYMAKDVRVRLVEHEKNQGLGPARNTGVEYARAPYIGFVDSDDYVALNMYETMLRLIEQTNVDWVWCGIGSVEDDGSRELNTDLLISGVFSSEKVLQNPSLYATFLPSWNKLYKKELVADIKQPAIVSEDQPFLATYITRCKKICMTNETTYYYRKRAGSLSKPKLQNASSWDAFFYSHKLFFQNLHAGINDKRVNQIQTSKRAFSIFWRINEFRLYEQPTWDEQRVAIAQHLMAQDIPLRNANPYLNWIVTKMFSKTYSPAKTLSLAKFGMRLCNYYSTHGSLLRFVYFLLREFLQILKRRCIIIADKIEMIFARFCALFIKKNKWLIGERLDTAQDNGKYFYDYMQTVHPEVKSYYVDESWVNTWMHKMLFYATKVYANSHYNAAFPLTHFGNRRYRPSKQMYNVFLQHGITYADVSPYYGKNASSIDLFICGAKPEYDAVLQHFGFAEQEVAYTGFARFDGLHNFQIKRQILLMPTWRRELAEQSEEVFCQSDYYKTLHNLLTNKDLLVFIQEHNMQLLFAPHYEMHRFVHLFNDVVSDYVYIADTQQCSVQQMLKESMMLITDVSSVQFDFAYMHKPLLYYWWDYEKIVQTHLQKGYFDFEKMGFGPVVRSQEALMNRLRAVAANNWKTEEEYNQKINAFFPLHDTNNCERIYQTIIERK